MLLNNEITHSLKAGKFIVPIHLAYRKQTLTESITGNQAVRHCYVEKMCGIDF
jgi:hypothetical protein